MEGRLKQCSLVYDKRPHANLLDIFSCMAKPKKWQNITLPPEVMERLKSIPGVSARRRIEWLLDAVEQNSLTKVTYDELTEYVVNQSKSQKKEKILGLIMELLRCLV